MRSPCRAIKKRRRLMRTGRFDGEILPLEIEEVTPGTHGPVRSTVVLDKDEHVRPDTTMEGLGKLRPVFKQGGTVTAGNASPLSDGAAAVIVMERSKAEALGLKPLARFVGFNVAGVRPEIMGIGPIKAVPKLLDRVGMTLDEIDLIELNEAFAAQAVAVIRELGMDPEKVNVNGGAIALGHPLGCTGAKLTVQITNEMKRQNSPLRHGHHVHRRRHGRSRHLRKPGLRGLATDFDTDYARISLVTLRLIQSSFGKD